MKRFIIGTIVLLSLALISVYFYIPHHLIISKVALVNCNSVAASRTLIETDAWRTKLFTKNTIEDFNNSNPKKYFIYKSDTFEIIRKLHNSLDIDITSRDYQTKSSLNIFPVTPDSVALNWISNLSTGSNPIDKIKRYQQAVRLKKNMTGILNELSKFLQKKENIYGLQIEKTSTRDTFLVAAKSSFSTFPSTTNIYSLVTKLKSFLAQQGALPTNAPMLNITSDDKNAFNVIVAIPTNKKIQDTGAFFFRRMIPGSFLVTNVQGGQQTIEHALENLRLYISDHQKISMAIPFQSLITDRSKEPDTTRWITKIYYPVNY